MKVLLIGFLCWLEAAASPTMLCAEQKTETVLQLLADASIRSSTNTNDVPRCVKRELRRWYDRPFVLVRRPEEFPKLTDIRRAGDGRFCLLFFARVGNSAYVLCFKDYASIGIVDRAVIFRIKGGRCVVVEDYALPSTPRSVDELRRVIRKIRT